MRDIFLLIKRNQGLLNQIEGEYYALLEKKEIPDNLILDLKDFYGNIKSILDYAWKYKGQKGNFPMRNSKKDFKKSVQLLNGKILECVEKFQPYNNNISKNLNLINNGYKHLCLIPQKRIEETRVTVSGNGGGSVSWGSGVTFGAGVSIMGIPVNPSTQRPIPNNIVTTKEEKWISFLFDANSVKGIDDNINVLGFSKETFEAVQTIVSELEIKEE